MSLYNSAIPLGNTPDDYQGYGRVDLLNVLPLASSPFSLFVHESSLLQIQENVFTVSISDSSQPFKVRLSAGILPVKCVINDFPFVPCVFCVP